MVYGLQGKLVIFISKGDSYKENWYIARKMQEDWGLGMFYQENDANER